MKLNLTIGQLAHHAVRQAVLWGIQDDQGDIVDTYWSEREQNPQHLVVATPEEILDLLAQQGRPVEPERVVIERSLLTITLGYECHILVASSVTPAPEPQFISVETLAQAQAVYQGWLEGLVHRGFDVTGAPKQVEVYDPQKGGGVVLERTGEVVEFEVHAVLEVDVVYQVL